MTSFKDDVISDLKHVCLNVKFEFTKNWKKKRIMIVMLLAILLPVIFYVVPLAFDVDYAETANGFATSNLGFITLLIIISAAMFTGDSISSEFENRTGLILFPTPQRQNSIFVGKYVAALLATWLAVSLYYLITVLEIAQIYGTAEVTVELAKSFMLALLYSASAVSLIYFFSAVMKRTITSTLIGFFALMMILPIIGLVLSIAEVDPWFLVTHSSSLITDVMNVASSGGFGPGNEHDVGSLTSFSPDFYEGIWVMLTYTIGFFVAGLTMANRKKMEG